MLRLTLILAVVFLLITSCKQSNDSSYLQTITSSLESANQSILNHNLSIFGSLERKLREPMTASRAQMWHPRAATVHKYATEVLYYLKNIKSEIGVQGKNKSLGEEKRRESLLEQIKTLQFLPRLANYKKQIVAAMNTDFMVDNPTFREHLQKDSQSILKELPVFVNNQDLDSTFRNSDYALCVTMLYSLENNVLVSENRLLDYFDNQCEVFMHGYDRFSVITVLNSSYVKSGETIEVIAGMGKFSVESQPTITIDGKQMKTGPDGAAIYSFRANKKPGRHTVQIQIEYTMPDGTKRIVTKNSPYTIAP